MADNEVKLVIELFNTSIEKIENDLIEEEFKEYCDATATIVTYWRIKLKRQEKNGK
jgi:hypothetical protein